MNKHARVAAGGMLFALWACFRLGALPAAADRNRALAADRKRPETKCNMAAQNATYS